MDRPVLPAYSKFLHFFESSENMEHQASKVAVITGDDPEKASDLIVAFLGKKSASINGRFLWSTDGLQPTISSWGSHEPHEVWR